MKRGTFTMNSHDGKTKLHGVTWEPEGKVRAVVQIVHGMIEYIERLFRHRPRPSGTRGICGVPGRLGIF